jgi:hypothetical protein
MIDDYLIHTILQFEANIDDFTIRGGILAPLNAEDVQYV